MPDERLKWARARYLSASGEYRCGWEIGQESTLYRITIPFDCSAEFVLPKMAGSVFVNGEADEELEKTGRKVFEPGTYEIVAGE